MNSGVIDETQFLSRSEEFSKRASSADITVNSDLPSNQLAGLPFPVMGKESIKRKKRKMLKPIL